MNGAELNPRVSIIIPFYNAEQFIQNAARDLMMQTRHDIEIIFVNDGSTDGSVDRLKQVVGSDKRCKVLTEENKGPGVARNLGIEYAKGEYVIFLDVDDRYEGNLVECLLQTQEATDADIVIFGFRQFNEQTGSITTNKMAIRDMYIPKRRSCFSPQEAKDNLFSISTAFVWNKMFRTEFIRKNKLIFPEKYCYEDVEMLFRAYTYSERIAIDHRELIIYRRASGESISDHPDLYWNDLISTYETIRDDLRKRDQYNLYQKAFLQRYVEALYSVMRGYITEEAFCGIYDYIQKNMIDEIRQNKARLVLNDLQKEFLEVLLRSNSPLDFCLKLRTIKNPITAAELYKKFWKFPYDTIEANKKIVLYGAGDVGTDLYIQINETKWCSIIAWVDACPEKYTNKGFPVENIRVVTEREYDYLIICVRDDKSIDAIRDSLVKIQVPEQKIRVFEPYSNHSNVVSRFKESAPYQC